jgi:hypothetical protein
VSKEWVYLVSSKIRPLALAVTVKLELVFQIRLDSIVIFAGTGVLRRHSNFGMRTGLRVYTSI